MITNYLLIEVEESKNNFNEDVVELEEVDDDLTSIAAADRTLLIIKKLVIL